MTADLTAAAVYKTGGARHPRPRGLPELVLAKWLILGSVPMAFLGPGWSTTLAGDEDQLDSVLKEMIGFALLLAASTYALRLYINLRQVRGGAPDADPNPTIRPSPTLLVGALGGLLVGITSVARGSVIMVALLMMYPGLAAVRLVGTDLVQAVPLVLSAAVSNILVIHGIDWRITIPLIVGSVPGHDHWQRGGAAGAAVGDPPRDRRRADDVRGRAARQGRVGAARQGADPSGADRPRGSAMIVLVPLIWGLLRRGQGLPMFGSPTVAELEGARATEPETVPEVARDIRPASLRQTRSVDPTGERPRPTRVRRALLAAAAAVLGFVLTACGTDTAPDDGVGQVVAHPPTYDRLAKCQPDGLPKATSSPLSSPRTTPSVSWSTASA